MSSENHQKLFLDEINEILEREHEEGDGMGGELNAVIALFNRYKIGKESYKAYEVCIAMLEKNEMEMFYWCINQGYAFDMKDKDGYNLFDRVLKLGDLDAAKNIQHKWTEILTKQSSSKGRLSIVDYNARFVNKLNGENALHLIAKTNYDGNRRNINEDGIISICIWLLDVQGLSLIQNKDGDTPVHLAMKTNKFNLALYLAKRFQDKNVINLQNNKGESAMQLLREKSQDNNNMDVFNNFQLELQNNFRSINSNKRNESNNSDFEYLYKVILIGNASVGKTFVLSRYVSGSCPERQPATVGVEIALKLGRLKNGDRVKCQIWDTAGQERYNAITKTHYRRAHAAIVMYDITNRSSFVSLDMWVKELKRYGKENMVIYIVGNKEDLRSAPEKYNLTEDFKKAIVQKHEGVRFAQRYELSSLLRDNQPLHMVTSAKTGENVEHLFQSVYEEIFEKFGNTLGARIQNWEPKEDVQFDIPKITGKNDNDDEHKCC